MRRPDTSALGLAGARSPVHTYEQACWWLIRAFDLVEAPLLPSEALPSAAQLVADVYWIGEDQLRRDLLRLVREVNPPPRRLRREVRRYYLERV